MKKIKEIINKAMAADNKIKKTLFVIALAGLSCTIWHNYIKIFDIGDLKGDSKKEETVSLNFKNWFSGTYQEKMNQYVVLNNLLSPFFVKVNNQIEYSFFGKLHMHDGIIGKENYLYESSYVKTYFGEDFIGEDSLRHYVEKMKFIQDTLQKLNKEFIYIQAPGKTSYYPEFLPDSLLADEADLTNYKILSKLLNEYKINHIDFRPFFLAAKKTTAYPLFTRTGIHWSKYSQAIVMDSINNFIEATAKIDMPEVSWDEVEIDYADIEDADIEGILNLLFSLNNDKYAYPILKIEPRENKDVPVVLMVGDSYLGNLYWGHFYESFDLKSQFWFYNGSVFSPVFNDKIHKFQQNQLQNLKKSDIVILGCNEPNIKGTSWGFVDDMYNYYKNGIATSQYRIDYMKKVDSCVATMEDYNMEKLKQYSKKQNVSMDSAKVIYCLWKFHGNKTP